MITLLPTRVIKHAFHMQCTHNNAFILIGTQEQEKKPCSCTHPPGIYNRLYHNQKDHPHTNTHTHPSHLLRKNHPQHRSKRFLEFQNLLDVRLHRLSRCASELVLLLHTTTTLSGNGIKVLVLIRGVFILIGGTGIGDGKVFEISLLFVSFFRTKIGFCRKVGK